MKKLPNIKRKVSIFVITLCLFSLVVLWGISSLEPLVLAFAEESFKNRVTRIVSQSVAEVIEGVSETSELVTLETDSEGNVTSLSLNTAKINVLKSEVSLKLVDKLNRDVRIEKVPLGNLTGILFLSGKGPSFGVRLTDVESVILETDSSFSTEGINQTRHTVTLRLEMRLSIALFTKVKEVCIQDGIVVADTVIVGRVPDGFTSINKADNELIGDIVDFRAE